MDEDSRGAQPPPQVVDRPEVADRQRRIRNWAIFVALAAMAGFVYAIAIVRMVQSHSLPHFF